ncbi:hypothetical protein B6N60_03462 [Richelia sinica FACHB-800]|uniref:Uncharacterized protein n=1 Tax=Richelia sinica FACHB-800 TaxID=1357546 RepID=A0A975T9U5_9NOST|nr:hypothetical protein B6N60_03462 [Richelia sinica FACHB-800]
MGIKLTDVDGYLGNGVVPSVVVTQPRATWGEHRHLSPQP